MKIFKEVKYLPLIISLGLLLRLFFTLVVAGFYFNRPDIYTDADTGAWATSFQNLIETGSYTINPDHEYGYFARMPGYSFFLGVFWLILGEWDMVYPVVAYFQIILDVISIWLVYRICLAWFGSKRTANIVSFLYAVYPFIIVWNPVAYSESVSVFLMLSGLYFFSRETRYSVLITGLLLGLAVLFRPQILFLLPVLALILFWKSPNKLRKITLFCLGVFLSYGVWPLRNWINHDKIILTQDLRGIPNWNEDVISFMQYTYSVKAEWEPQFSSIIKNKETHWPKEAYIDSNDSMLLEFAVNLSKNCGSGFSHWRDYWKKPIDSGDNCNKLISDIFTYLRNKQINHNPFHFWIAVPLANLSKALFKNSLNNNAGFYRKAASFLFYYRTLLIFMGLAGIWVLMRKRKYIGWVFLLFFLLVYFTLCFGTGPQMRNIEIRYFLHIDVLLLFSAGYLISLLIKKQKEV
ncbi:TPA: hypothetical protein ENS27_00465 [bacterium]|nr:hypothetical protein [bacterium]